MEIWKEIIGWEGKYSVSNLGRVMSIKNGNKILSAQSTRWYPQVRLRRPNKQAKVHRLVADAFLPNPLNKKCVNHKDGNKHNNNADNLEWCSHSENTKHAYDMGILKFNPANMKGRRWYQ